MYKITITMGKYRVCGGDSDDKEACKAYKSQCRIVLFGDGEYSKVVKVIDIHIVPSLERMSRTSRKTIDFHHRNHSVAVFAILFLAPNRGTNLNERNLQW